MLKNLEELKTYPFVQYCLAGKITWEKIKLFVEDINKFIENLSFREKFGFENKKYSEREAISIIRQILGQKINKRVIEFDEGTFAELTGKTHPFDLEIKEALKKIGLIIGEREFADIVPLIFLVRKEEMGSWDEVKELIKSRIEIYFRRLDSEDILNLCSGIYNVKTSDKTLGHLIVDDRINCIPSIVSIPNKGTINHETIHFIQNLFYFVPSAEIGGLSGTFGEDPASYSFFMAEFLGYLVEHGNTESYKKVIHHPQKIYRFAYPTIIDNEYDRRLDEFSTYLRRFIDQNVDGLLSFIALYPNFKQEENELARWENFEVPENSVEDFKRFKEYLIKYGYNSNVGISPESGLGVFLRNQFIQHARQWFQIYKNQ